MKRHVIYLNPALIVFLTMLTACAKHNEFKEHQHTASETTCAEQCEESHGEWCKEHDLPEAECGICHPELVGKLKPGATVKVRLPAPDSAAMAGVQITTPTIENITESIESFAEIVFNQNRLACLVAPVNGIIRTVEADLGHKVEEKQVLARIWSAVVAEAAARAVLTRQTLDRERKLRAEQVTSEKDLQEAEAAYQAARQQFLTMGFSENQIDILRRNPHESVLLEVCAPFAGEIVERAVVPGTLVEAGKPLFTLADRSFMWAMLNIPESALSRVYPGQTVELQVDALPGRTFTGKLTWVAAEVDERTRMVRARAEIPNPDGLLRARMFAQARILTQSTGEALLVPSSAIQYVGGQPLVFVQVSEGLFEVRPVRLGVRFKEQQEVLDGLKPQDQLVVTRGFAIKSQLLISRLGAGCAD